MDRTRNLILLLAFFICVPGVSLLPVGCSGPPPARLVLNDFESDGDLDHIHWRCRSLFSLSEKHAVNGSFSLAMELYPAEYPGLALKVPEHDWSRYRFIAFEIYNPQEQTLAITVRIDDRRDHPPFEDRYQGKYLLQPGANTIRLSLRDLRVSGSGRPLNLKTIRRFMWFLVDTSEVYTFYVDYFRLEG